MKKTKSILRIALVLSMLFILSECTGQKSDKAEAKKVAQTEKNTEQIPDTDESIVKYKVTFIELGSVKCIPCQQMQPVMDTIRERYGSQVNVVFCDVWTPEGAPFADKYGVSAIPTQVFLDENGLEYFRHVGFLPIDELVNILSQKGVK